MLEKYEQLFTRPALGDDGQLAPKLLELWANNTSAVLGKPCPYELIDAETLKINQREKTGDVTAPDEERLLPNQSKDSDEISIEITRQERMGVSGENSLDEDSSQKDLSKRSDEDLREQQNAGFDYSNNFPVGDMDGESHMLIDDNVIDQQEELPDFHANNDEARK